MNNKRTIIIYASNIEIARSKLKQITHNYDSVIKKQSNNMMSFVNGDAYYLFVQGYNVRGIRADYIYIDKLVSIECLEHEIYPLLGHGEHVDMELF